MGERLIKPYEISVWEDKLTPNGFIEKKLAVIGSDTMAGLNKVYDPVFNKKVNGEKTLSFSLKYKYFDPYSGNSDYINPFAALLINERKIKLYYDEQWYEFIIKDHTESSDGLIWTYTCSDAFVLELSKTGYNITFDSELNNNQGTAEELAKETLKATDWHVGDANIGRQMIAEPIYRGTINGSFSALNTDTGVEEVCSGDVYVFYSYVKNHDGKFVQFIKQANTYTVDDNNVITATNYRILRDNIVVTDMTINSGNVTLININDIETHYQANRLVYGQRTTYDPVMKRTVDLFKTGDREIYKYTDYTYTTSNVVMNYITNGDNFNVLEDGSLQGWNPYVGGGDITKLELLTKPELGTGKELADLTVLSQIEGYLKASFTGNTTAGYKAIFNSGIENNSSFIESIAKGDKFVFRWRAGVGPSVNELSETQNLRFIVAGYTQDAANPYRNYYKYIDPNNIIIECDNVTPMQLNNYIRGGIIDDNIYYIDGVAQVPSTKYIYVVKNDNVEEEWVWDGENSSFISLNNPNCNYLPYYYVTATAKKAVSNKNLSDPTKKFGIFIYKTDNNNSPVYIQEIQLTRLVKDLDNKPILVGNVPTATAKTTDYYYIKPSNDLNAEDVETYTVLSELANDIGVEESSIKPVYNDDSKKVLSISASQSNCFNILQTIAETFECWIDLVVEHDEQGYITYQYQSTTDTVLDNSKTYYIWNNVNQAYEQVLTPNVQAINTYYERVRPNKYVCLKEYAGKENYAGFKYGININSIERQVNSDEIVTKLIVDLSQSDYTDEGYVSISNAPSNQSGESYILNFDYYYNQGLLDRAEAEEDKLQFISNVAKLNLQLQEKEKQKRNLEISLTEVESKRNVFTELVETAQDTQTSSLVKFEQLTGEKYESYKNRHHNLIQEENEEDQLTEEETILEVLGEIYSSSATINNYAGVVSNIEQEYWSIFNELYGSDNYIVKIWTERDINSVRHVFIELSDYLPNCSFNIDDNIKTSTVNCKYWDIETNATSITITVPESYIIDNSGHEKTYKINNNKVNKIRINSNDSISGIVDDIQELQEQKDELTKEFNNKYSRYIQEGTWNSTDYIDSELYYLDALQISNTSAQPTVSYTINVVEISELEGFEWYLFDAGDKTYIEDTEFFGWANVHGHLTPAREEVIVAEVEWHLEEPENNVITVQNYKTRFEDLFQRISAAVQTVQYNEATYAKISSLLDSNGTINQDVLLESLNRISGQNYNLTSDGSVVINGDQILVRNLTNPANCVIINSEGIRISSDGGQTWRTAIDGQGINIGTVYTGTLNTQNVIIGSSDNPSFRWDKSGISAYKSTQSGMYDLKTYVRYDEFGLYGVKNGAGFKAQKLQDVLDKAHFAVTWDGFFIRNDYTGGGRVEITSDNDFRVLNTVDDNENEKIKIGALEWMVPAEATFLPEKTYYILTENGYEEVEEPSALDINSYYEKKFTPQKGVAPSLYGIRIKNNAGVDVMKTDDEGNLILTGAIEALEGNFSKLITVGKNDETVENWIEIDGVHSLIKSSDYSDGAGYGWMINKDGDAVFNNITARGAIKTAVFEYAEIQAVGGIFIFRPSSTIRSARIASNGTDLIVKVEKPFLFANIKYNEVQNPVEGTNPKQAGWYERTKYGYKETDNTTIVITTTYYEQQVICGSWCKVSNYTEHGSEPNISNILLNNGLTHVYEVSNVNFQRSEVTLLGAAAMVDGNQAVTTLEELKGGALIDMGRAANTTGYDKGAHNYGIGINSSDNTVNLPARSISLFETIINSNSSNNIKVTYDIKSVLGTLPILLYEGSTQKVNVLYHDNLEGTEGIYTDNMYIGNHEQYITFYSSWEDRSDKHLKINTKELTLKAGTYNTAQDDSNQNFVYLSSDDYGSYIKINNHNTTDWRLIIGKKFGVDRAGNLYASNANIEGHIHATSGSFGSGAEIDQSGNFIVNQSAVDGLEESLTTVMNEASHKGYTLYVQSTNDSQNSVTLTAHVYYGNKEITSNMDAGLFLWYQKNEGSNTSTLLASHVKSVVFDKTTAGYGTTVICSLALDDEVLLVTPDYYALETPDGYLLTAHV